MAAERGLREPDSALHWLGLRNRFKGLKLHAEIQIHILIEAADGRPVLAADR